MHIDVQMRGEILAISEGDLIAIAVLFGLMVIPPLAARSVAFNMTFFYVFSSAIGLATALIGFVVSYVLDWPLGPTDVLVAFVLPVLIRLGRKIAGTVRPVRV